MERSQRLKELLKEKILVLDGAMGTLCRRSLTAAGLRRRGPRRLQRGLILTRPDVVEAIHRGYLEAGADIIETNTFGGTPLVLGEYGHRRQGLRDQPAGSRARPPEADEYSTPERPALRGRLDGADHQGHLRHRRRHLRGAGRQLRGAGRGASSRAASDYLLIETCQDTRNVKAALLGIERAFDAAGRARAGRGVRAPSSRWARCSPGQIGRGAGRVARARRPPLPRPQLRHRPGVHDRPHPLARASSRRSRSPACPTRAFPTRTASTSRRRR